MKIEKEAVTEKAAAVSAEDLALINGFSKKTLAADEVFVFDMALCDNEVDRDFERFETGALPELAKLFVGKTGIFDHEWSAAGQKARIFKAAAVTDGERRTAAGEPYTYLRASAYMLREGNAGLIAEIEGGIKREVSVGCSMAKSVCSVCGEESGSAKCGHVPGREYGGRTCCAVLSGALDAYEWSFVAVPAQKGAGVIKKFRGERGKMTLEEFMAEPENAGYAGEFAHLKSMSRMGESYLKELRDEVVRLGVLSGGGFDGGLLRKTAEKMDEEELLGFRKAFEKRIDGTFPPDPQLRGEVRADPEDGGEEFRI